MTFWLWKLRLAKCCWLPFYPNEALPCDALCAPRYRQKLPLFVHGIGNRERATVDALGCSSATKRIVCRWGNAVGVLARTAEADFIGLGQPIPNERFRVLAADHVPFGTVNLGVGAAVTMEEFPKFESHIIGMGQD